MCLGETDNPTTKLMNIMRQISLKSILSIPLLLTMATAVPAQQVEKGFVSLFDGKTLEGWKINEAPEAFSVHEGAIKANGNRCHLFYQGPVNQGKFKDFELRLDVMTLKNSNGGVFIHTVFQNDGWPSGYEIQVNNTQEDVQKSGGLYNTVPNAVPFKDDVWMKYVIIVKNGKVKVSVDGKELVNHKPEPDQSKLLPDGGTIAIQSHDPGSTTMYKNIRIKLLD